MQDHVDLAGVASQDDVGTTRGTIRTITIKDNCRPALKGVNSDADSIDAEYSQRKQAKRAAFFLILIATPRGRTTDLRVGKVWVNQEPFFAAS
jgi:hypothetical protein